MAQAANYDEFQEDPSLDDEEGGGKTGFMSKLKDKTKNTGRKLKSKLKPGSTSSDSTETGGEEGEGEEGEEEVTPTQNAFSGQTQSAFHQKDDQTPIGTTGPTSAEPAQNFPGDFADIADGKTGSQPNADEEGLTKSFQGLSTKESTNEGDKPMTEKFSDNLTSAKDQTKETVFGGDNSESQYTSPDAPPATEKASDATQQMGEKASDATQQMGEKASDATQQLGGKASDVTQQLGGKASDTTQQVGETGSETSQQLGDKASETGKSWSQWAAEKVGYAKDTAAAKAPTTADGKPIHHQAYDTMVGAKDSAVGTAYGTKDSLGTQTDPNQIPSDPARQTYVQKATGAAYGAKDSLYSATQPGEHDKALSQKVTETVGNLPATLKSYLPGGKPASSQTTTPASSDSPVSPTTEEAAEAPPQSPSIVGRITGLFGAKKPATEESPLESTTAESTAEPTSTS